MKDNGIEYLREYYDLIEAFKSRSIAPQEIGEVLTRLAHYFAVYNLRLVDALRARREAHKSCEEQADSNGKPISSAKAQVMADATPEAHDYETAKAHVLNIEQMINALKVLARSMSVELQNSGL